MQKQDLGLLENWIRSIRDVYRIHQQSMYMIDNAEDRMRKLVELNVVEQCLNLYKTGVVQRKRMECVARNEPVFPRVHAMVIKHINSINQLYLLYFIRFLTLKSDCCESCQLISKRQLINLRTSMTCTNLRTSMTCTNLQCTIVE
jgi:hypothetical protein